MITSGDKHCCIIHLLKLHYYFHILTVQRNVLLKGGGANDHGTSTLPQKGIAAQLKPEVYMHSTNRHITFFSDSMTLNKTEIVHVLRHLGLPKLSTFPKCQNNERERLFRDNFLFICSKSEVFRQCLPLPTPWKSNSLNSVLSYVSLVHFWTLTLLLY